MIKRHKFDLFDLSKDQFLQIFHWSRSWLNTIFFSQQCYREIILLQINPRNHAVTIIVLWFNAFCSNILCWKTLQGNPSQKTAPYKDCFQLLKKCNFASASQLFNECRHRHRSIAKVCLKSQPSTNIEYLVEHKTIQSKSKTGSHELTSQLCFTSPFL